MFRRVILVLLVSFSFFFFNYTATTEIYTLSLHDALPIFVAVFDTAFHATIPDAAATYAVSQRWRDDWGVRRYGFHGLSVQWATERVQVPRLVVCHLGG